MGLIKDIPTCKVLLDRIEQEANGVVESLTRSVKGTTAAKSRL